MIFSINRKSGFIIAALLPLLLAGCGKTVTDLNISVKNELGFDRQEIVALNHQQLADILKDNSENTLRIRKQGTSEYLPIQWIDYDGDGKNDELLFQAKVPANSSVYYDIIADSTIAVPESKQVAYSRFVPERTDDYTWENDKIAFRTYGPTGQKEALEGVAGSTLSSGIDLWLKRVNYPIINKWYSNHVKTPGYYHIDHGEGYDPYHVGGSRGTGGIGIWENDSLMVSQNYTGYKTISSGPLRTVFELSYASWSPYYVHETKRISLDIGANFSKFEITLKAEKPVPNYTVGISLHENKGESKIKQEKGWFRHWEQIDDSHVGEGIVIAPGDIEKAFAFKSEVPDQSNLLIVAKPTQKLIYYAGFAWDKSGQIQTVEDWDVILDQQAQVLKSPLKVSLKK
ncbi:DUF4861 family protein [Flavobacterium rhizosphaerae]|uniref:DUF4861 family protein n=1 Tax=Flavobacterium rhizosphaerae TaxID=3163298 RepID=A0ABW8YTG9_9FLAO